MIGGTYVPNEKFAKLRNTVANPAISFPSNRRYTHLC